MYMCHAIKKNDGELCLWQKPNRQTGTKDHRPIQMYLFSGAEIGMEKKIIEVCFKP